MKVTLRYPLAVAMLAVAMIPSLGGCLGNVVGGCPITDDGKDDCAEGETECTSDTSFRRCISAGPCDAYWTENECAKGQRCVVTDGTAACK